MSNIIPMVSSSPPPMDEGGGFEWEDDDDFGTFTSASDNSFAHSDTTGKADTTIPDHLNSDSHSKNADDFADFAMFPSNEEDPANMQFSKPQLNDQRPESINISHNSPDDKKTTDTTTNKINNHVNGPLIDSGVYSSNVSPVQCEENSGVNHLHNNIDGTSTSESQPLHDLSCTLSEKIEKTSEENEISDSKPDAGMTIPCDDSVSDTQENVNVVNDSENTCVTEVQDDSIKCIPPKDIPENDHIHISGNVITDNETVENRKNTSANVVIPNCDSDTVNSLSSSDNSHSVSNISNQESGHEQNVDRTDLNEDIPDLRQDAEEEENEGNNSDYGNFSSENVTPLDKQMIGCDNDLQRTEQESEKLETVHIENDKLRDQQDDIESKLVPSEDTVEDAIGATCTNADKNDEDENVNLSHKESSSVEDKCANEITDEDVSDSESVNVKDIHDETENEHKVISKSDEDRNITEQVAHNNECAFENNLKSAEDLNLTKDDSVDVDNSDDHLQEIPVSDNNNSNHHHKDENNDINVKENKEEAIINEENDDFGDFSATDVKSVKVEGSGIDSANCEVVSDEFGDFNASSETKSNNDNFEVQDEDEDFGEFNASFDSKSISNTPEMAENNEEFGDFNASFDSKPISDNSEMKGNNEEFGDFNTTFPEKSDSKADPVDEFGDFNATFDGTSDSNEQTNDWAAFSEPQTVTVAEADEEEDDWAGFEGGDNSAPAVSETVPSQHKIDESSKLANMTKHEKLLYAVTTCFPALISDFEVCDMNIGELQDLHIDSTSHVWGQVKGRETTEALSYQWTKSLWNSQLFSTLHIDTKNILIGHKKAPVPVYAAGLTLLEPTKGQAPLKPDVLVETSISSINSTSQDSIPAAQFDWSSSGLTNPLEANNKTLNLDFLIQDQATKSNALETEFLSTNDSPVHKPAIQPLENILANLKTSSTFKPANQHEDVSKEASKVLLSLPDLLFMKSKVLMFPVKLDGVEN
ncbi:aftiphilin-like isoform X2 [Ruditapes philippinarum]|uniref:aftiphilin-like isoform X2 n=1 Tax=Ruditapes philippinarum TaxID=129788 RepID=UPI00295C29B4|nr:aftiphilin-like isoform X2 [Ruditapes philippinarum]